MNGIASRLTILGRSLPVAPLLSAAANGAQSGAPPPANASANTRAGDWTCHHGFRRSGDACVAQKAN